VTDTCVTFEEVARDPVELSRRLLAEPRLPWFVATREDEVVGYAYASQHRARRAYR
jgi:L-amino acid N-acyltransferase YncA